MNLKFLFSCMILVIVGSMVSCSPQSQVSTPKPPAQSAKPSASVNCGPKILLEICKVYNIPATESELTTLSDTKNGVSSFRGLSTAMKAKGLECLGAEVDFDHLKKISEDNHVITHLSQTYHFVLIKEIKEKTIALYYR